MENLSPPVEVPKTGQAKVVRKAKAAATSTGATAKKSGVSAKAEKRSNTATSEPAAGPGSGNDESQLPSARCTDIHECHDAYVSAVKIYQIAQDQYCADGKRSKDTEGGCNAIERLAIQCGVFYLLRLTEQDWLNDTFRYEQTKEVLTATLRPDLTKVPVAPSDVIQAAIRILSDMKTDAQRSAFVELLAALRNPSAVESLKGWLKHSQDPKLTSIGEKIGQGNLIAIAELLKTLKEEELRQVSTMLYNGRERRFGTGWSSAKLQVVFMGVTEPRHIQFKNALLNFLSAKFPDRLLTPIVESQPPNRLEDDAKRLANDCSGPVLDKQCDAILIVPFQNARASAAIFTVRTSGEIDSAGSVLQSEEIPMEDSFTVASRFYLALSRSFSVLRGSVNMAVPDIERIGPPLHAGVGIDIRTEMAARDVPAIFADRKGLSIDGDCGQPAFVNALKMRLSTSYHRSIGELGKWTDRPTLRLSHDPTRQGCIGALGAPASAGSTEVLRVAVTPAADDKGSWSSAGQDLGRVVGQFYVDTVNEGRTTVSPLWALVSSGIPLVQSTDPKRRTLGWLASTVDTVALVGGGAALVWAAESRNAYAGDHSQSTLDRSNAAYTAGFTALSIGIGMRLLGVTVFGLAPSLAAGSEDINPR